MAFASLTHVATPVAVLAFAVVMPWANAGTCVPRASLAGDRETIVKVSDELHRLGVATEPPPPGCTAIQTTVKVAVGGGIAIEIHDASQRTEDRVVGDAAVAAAWIDSWVRDDLAGVDGLAAPGAVAAPPPRVAQVDEPPRDTGVPDVSSAPSILDRATLRVGYAHAWTGDGSGWDGLEVAGCLHVGPTCLGARAAALSQAQLPSRRTLASRSDLFVLATASTTFTVGRMAIVPELGLGVGRLHTERVDGCRVAQPASCQDPDHPSGPMCNPRPTRCVDAGDAVYVGDGYQTATIAPRAAASIRIEIPIAQHLWLDGGASVVVAPGNHGGAFQAMPVGAPPVAQDQLALPGEPFASYQLGIGLRIGAP